MLQPGRSFLNKRWISWNQRLICLTKITVVKLTRNKFKKYCSSWVLTREIKLFLTCSMTFSKLTDQSNLTNFCKLSTVDWETAKVHKVFKKYSHCMTTIRLELLISKKWNSQQRNLDKRWTTNKFCKWCTILIFLIKRIQTRHLLLLNFMR